MAGAPLQTTLDCPACGAARLEIMAVSAVDPRLLLACPGCGAGFWDPELRDRFSVQRLGSVLQPASEPEVRRAGWRALLTTR